jgi:hypothetical protein
MPPSAAICVKKTNREGFIENQAFADFRSAVISVLTQVEADVARTASGSMKGRAKMVVVVIKPSERRSYGASGGGLASSSLDESDGGSACPKLMT